MSARRTLAFAGWVGVALGGALGAQTPRSGNPILPGWYADPEAHVFDGQYWIYPTYSAPYDDQVFMDAFSSTDLITWTKHAHIVDTSSVRWARRAMWAPSIVEKDGWYYLFFGANDVQSDKERGGIGVARSRAPGGPFVDQLGKPLIDAFHNGAQPIDQNVFRDRDGSYYIVYGGWRHCNIAKLNDDFTGLVPFPDGSTFKEITPAGYVEGAYMLLKDDKYYFMWSEGGWTGPDYAVAYAIGSSPLGPFERIGKILKQDSTVATGAGHHSMLNVGDKWYIVYHRRPLGETDRNHRVVSIDELKFDDRGMILPVVLTRTGVERNPPNRLRVDLDAARALVARVVPGHSRDFSLESIADSNGFDVFEVDRDPRGIVLRGSSGVAIASALNWYLEHVAGVNVSLPFTPLRLAKLAPVTAKVRISTAYQRRYFFNYCTFSYSMAWWDWSQWEQLIDWMALKGINTPLAVTGQEAVWRLVLEDLGYTRKQRDDFLVGPAYFPWGWMGNVDGLGGPLPDSWIDSHITLERRILARERALGMTPVLQAFTGHVPESTKDVFPTATLHKTGDWSAGFSGTWFVDPLDPLFQRFGTQFIKRQTELFGTDHLYAADPFNEIDPPSNDSTFLAGMGRAIYSGMHSADTSATWLLQGWFLYYQAKFWQDPQARALLGAVPNDRMIVLDLWGDRYPVWEKRQAFYGKPWIWNVLYNFGGKVAVNGDLPRIAANLDSARRSPVRGRLSGLGMTMEGLGTNSIVPDFVFDQTWRESVPALNEWTRGYVARRYGSANASAWTAWQQLLATAYRSAPQTGNFLAERPQFYRKGVAYRSEPIAPYDVAVLVAALDTLLNAAPALGGNGAYRFDVVNITRQVLGQLAVPLVNDVEGAFTRRDTMALERSEQRVLRLLSDIDELLGTRPEFLLGRWIADATRWGNNDSERRLYEWNARNLITLWGSKCTEGQNDDLNLYAYKEWQGMFSSYFRPRWTEFFARLNQSVETNVPFDRAPFAADMCEWEKRWSGQTNSFPVRPQGDAIGVARRLRREYADLLSK